MHTLRNPVDFDMNPQILGFESYTPGLKYIFFNFPDTKFAQEYITRVLFVYRLAIFAVIALHQLLL